MESFTPKNLPTESGDRPIKTGKVKSGFVPYSSAFKDFGGNETPAESEDNLEAEHTSSVVEYVEEEGVVKKIVVKCSCGKVTEIDCVYDAE